MKCTSCGKGLSKESKYCRFCGSEQTGSKVVESVLAHDKHIVEEKEHFAGFWVRLGAYIIDLIGMIAGAGIFGYLLGYIGGYIFGESFVLAIGDLPDFVWVYFGYMIYNIPLLTIWSTTLGKYLYGLKVVDSKNDNLSFGLSLKRSLLQPFSTLFFGAGYWNINKNEKKQAWHDIKSGTVVLMKKKNLTLAYVATIMMVIVWVYLTYGLKE